jgi:hypothetical protein
MSLNMNDAAVALRSFGRRYNEVVTGPTGDDAWERKVRSTGGNGSALAHVEHATKTLQELTRALTALPSTKEPALTIPNLTEPSTDDSVKELVAALKSAGAEAGAALEARSHDDYDRSMKLNGKSTPVRTIVATVVEQCVTGLKHAEEAIENA